MATKKSARCARGLYSIDAETYFRSKIKIHFIPGGTNIMITHPDYCDIVPTRATALMDIYRITRAVVNHRREEEVLTWMQNMASIVHAMRIVDESKHHALVPRLLYDCFRFQIRDSELIIQLLKTIHSRLMGLWTIYSKDNFFQTSLHILKLEESISISKADYFAYFFRHARILKETFNGKWFAENSHELVAYCVTMGKTELLTILLKNGFCSNFERCQRGHPKFFGRPATFRELCCYSRSLAESCCRDDIPHVRKELAVIKTTIIYNFHFAKTDTTFATLIRCRPHRRLKDIYEALAILFRAIPVPSCRIPIDMEDFTCDVNSNASELKYRDQAPCRLKHLTRCAIRQRLGEKMLLPDGIRDLGLPRYLCDYLNLDID